MAKITIDGQTYEVRDGIPVLQAALELGFEIPHYCYHPALRVVASCRLCLMEMQVPDPKTGEMVWSPRLVPSCQTPVREGLVVRFDSEKVRSNVQHCMEYYLLNHPLDCPICDKAGECWLQDYSRKFGRATSRMIDEKYKNPKKDIGPRTILYMDRCVACTRCVRFTEEISGTAELCVVSRGNRVEIDVFPGRPLDNKLQGNVVDICPVGCLLDKHFLFKQRVWLLKSTESICPGCSTGCAIHVDSNEGRVWRLRPRFNPGVNDYWMCDEGRFGWEYVHDERRLSVPSAGRGDDAEALEWHDVPAAVNGRLERFAQEVGGEHFAVVLSPMLSLEEAWLIASVVRRHTPEAALVRGPVPMSDGDEHFPVGCRPEEARFTIRAEKAPNRRGVEAVIEALGGRRLSFEALASEESVQGAWITGGYPQPWVPEGLVEAARRWRLRIVSDMFPSPLVDPADVVLPMCAWVEREGSFMNHRGLIQPFRRAIDPPEGAMRDGQYLWEIWGGRGLYSAERIREMMAEQVPAVAEIVEPPPLPAHAH